MEWLKRRAPTFLLFRALIERAQRREIMLVMSMLNLGEVYYSCAKESFGDSPEAVLAMMRGLPISYVTVSDGRVYAAARLKAAYPIAYADAFAAQLAIEYAYPLMTGDKEFLALATAGLLTLEWMGA